MPHQNAQSAKAAAWDAVDGEQLDFLDEGDPSFGVHQGVNNTNREMHVHDPRASQQGVKTRSANKDIVSGRAPGGGGR